MYRKLDFKKPTMDHLFFVNKWTKASIVIIITTSVKEKNDPSITKGPFW